MVARRAHNPKVVGSSPAPATKEKDLTQSVRFFYFKCMKYYVYVIKSDEGYYYTGMTEDLDRRLSEHNNKTKSFWTKRGTGWEIIYYEEFDTRQDAFKRERWMKSGHGTKLLKEKGLK